MQLVSHIKHVTNNSVRPEKAGELAMARVLSHTADCCGC